jgi:hypothetical protein
MPLRIPPEDRKIVIGLAILFACALGLLLYTLHIDGGRGDIPSSYSSGNSGTKAAFLLLEQMGYAPRRWTEAPRRLEELPTGTMLVLAEPRPGEEEEVESIRRFVEKGGRVVGTGVTVSVFFPKLRIKPGMPHFQWKSYKPIEPSDLTRGIDEIEMAPQLYFDSSTCETPFADGDETPVGRSAFGSGEVIWWASSDPFTNSGIREKDNVQLLLNSVGIQGRGPVYWDEYFHQKGKTVVDSILDSPLRWGFVQVALIGIAMIFTYSRRFGPERASIAESRAAPMEYVETLAALYNRARAAHIPVEVVYERFRAGLQRRYSIRTDVTVEQVAQTIVDHYGDSDLSSVIRTLREIEDSQSDPTFTVKRATSLVRQMHQWTTRMN